MFGLDEPGLQHTSGISGMKMRPAASADEFRSLDRSPRAGVYSAVESVDGEAIFYAKTDDLEANSLWTAAASGGHERMLVPTLYRRNMAPVTSGVYISTNRGLQGGPEILFYRFADQTTRNVYRLPSPIALGLSVMPDESWLLFNQLDGSGADLMLIDGFSAIR
jgi:hypothetical protein